MTPGERASDGDDQRSAEERAEELMRRVAGDGSRWLRRAFGRTREELDDIWAEAVSVRARWRGPDS